MASSGRELAPVQPRDAAGLLTHALVKEGVVEERQYQVNIARECVKRSTLVILPTGMGKTVIALLVIADRVLARPGKVLLLAPTKPLVDQHGAFLENHLKGLRVARLTGEVGPNDREGQWADADVIVSTPQVVQNDLLGGRVSLSDVTLVIFDEAHRAVGDYAYPFIARRYRGEREDGLTLGITASPGADPARIREVCDNLGIEGVEARSEEDPDVQPYVQPLRMEWVEVPLPETLRRVSDVLASIVHERLDELRRAGVYHSRDISKRELLLAQERIQARLRDASHDEAGPIMRLSSRAAEVLKGHHGMELAETQGLAALRSYLGRLEGDTSKAARNLLADKRMDLVDELSRDLRVEHPKLRRVAVLLERQLREKPDARIIVFTHYRDTAALLTDALAKLPGVRPARFVGQATRGRAANGSGGAEDKGMSQKSQAETIARYRAGELNVLVATSVAEEGLDIPSTDLVVFYEPVPSEIRTIQRRGRTARTRPGRVVVLVTKGTRDEAHYWTAKGKERRMHAEINVLRGMVGRVNASLERFEAAGARLGDATVATASSVPDATDAAEEQTRLETFEGAADIAAPASPLGEVPARRPAASGRGAGITIIADHREYNSPVVRELAELGVRVEAAQLPHADFFLSDRVAIERKSGRDLVTSLTEGRLLSQVKLLASSVELPILLVEGDPLEASKAMRPEAVHGALATILASFRVTVLMTRDAAETARLLLAIARREQLDERRPVRSRGAKAAVSLAARQRFVVEGLPGVSATIARRLLAHFGTVAGIVAATPEALMEVDGVGPETAKRIREVLDQTFTEEDHDG